MGQQEDDEEMLVQEEPAGSAAGGGPPNISEKLQLHETLQEKHHRLQQLMQVNRKLRTTFDAKKSKTDELKMQNNELERKLQVRGRESCPTRTFLREKKRTNCRCFPDGHRRGCPRLRRPPSATELGERCFCKHLDTTLCRRSDGV